MNQKIWMDIRRRLARHEEQIANALRRSVSDSDEGPSPSSEARNALLTKLAEIQQVRVEICRQFHPRSLRTSR